jgi:hypothetical protein
MSHGDRAKRTQPHPIESVSESSGAVVIEPERGPEDGTSATISTHSERGEGSSIKPYVSEIDHLVELFRAGERSRFEVVTSITQLLNGDADLSPQEKAQCFELYMAEVGSIQESPRARGKAKADGRPFVFGSHGSRLVEERGHGSGFVDEGDHEPREEESNGGGSSSSSGSDEDEPRKRRKLHQSDMPWSNRREEMVSQNPSCLKSASLIRKFYRDLKSTKLFIKLAPGAPRGIPMSEWEHIFKGEAVDLDKILSSFHRVSLDSEGKASVGDTEISISSVETKRKVETSSEWATSWRSASRAIAFVFKHREQELAEYGDYIERLFAAKRSSSHGQVILFDRGVRNEVGGGQTLLLTDYHYFTSLYAATLQDDGIEYNRSRRGGKGAKPGEPKSEVCLRFNSQGGCRFSESACKYQHSCLGCGQNGHGKPTCGK